MNYELKYLKYKMKYLNLLKNQSGGELKLGDTILVVEQSQIMYNGKIYTYMGQEELTPEPNGQNFPTITRIKLKNNTTEMIIPFETNKSKFSLVVKNKNKN
jgi:hypothetical protein